MSVKRYTLRSIYKALSSGQDLEMPDCDVIAETDYDALAAELAMLSDKAKIRWRKMKQIEMMPLPDGYYSESTVLKFLGYVCGDLPELHQLECPKMLEAWNRFKVVFNTDSVPVESKVKGEFFAILRSNGALACNDSGDPYIFERMGPHDNHTRRNQKVIRVQIVETSAKSEVAK